MHKLVMTILVFVLLLGIISPQNVAAQSLSDQIDELLRNRIEAAGVPPKIIVQGERVHASVVLPLFYERRTYQPAWCDADGSVQQVDALIEAIREADLEGLRADDYHLDKIVAIAENVRLDKAKGNAPNIGRLIDLDLLATDAFLIYSSHLLAGRVNPETIDPEWIANRREADLASVLQTALDTKQIKASLKQLLPPQSGYARLRQALSQYQSLEENGGWTAVPHGPKMQKGDIGERIELLRARLFITGDLDDNGNTEDNLFDDSLEQAVHKFQRRNGLEDDGVVGPATLETLNVPVEERVHQIEVNLERWRWLPQELGRRHILINVANFELDVNEDSQPVMTMRVVVGRDYRRTPVFTDQMTYLVFSPYWNVPTNIAVQDIVPKIRQNSDYLTNQNIKVFRGWGVEAKAINPQTIDWSRITAQNFNYRLRQEPGPLNALGRVKFMFPNKFNVYLHDTPARELFAKTERAFSSGCIRIEKPIELAEYLLRSDPKWTREKIFAVIDKHIEQTVRLPEPLPVHLLYWTAWANEDGSVQFRKDIYSRDKKLYEALLEKPSGS